MTRTQTGTGPRLAVEMYDTRIEWLAARNSGIGSSDALTVANERHPKAHHTLYSLWAQKSGFVPVGDLVDNRFTEWGNRLEPVLVEWAREQTGIEFIRRPFLIVRRHDKPHILASPDALSGAATEPDEGLEVKTADKKFADEWGETPPLYYVVQVQHQMLATHLKRWHVAALIGGNDPRLYVIERDEKFTASLERAEDRLWQRVLDGTPPPIAGRSPEHAALRALFPAEDPGSRVTLPADAVEWHRTREAAAEVLDAAEAIHEEMTLRIAQAMGGAERGDLPDGSGVYYTLSTESRKAYVKDVKAWSGRVLRPHVEKSKGPKTKKGTVV